MFRSPFSPTRLRGLAHHSCQQVTEAAEYYLFRGLSGRKQTSELQDRCGQRFADDPRLAPFDGGWTSVRLCGRLEN